MNTKQRLRSQCDKLFFERAMDLYGDDECGTPCGACEEQTSTQVHHFFPKGLYSNLRYNLKNAVPICIKCHFFHHHRGDPTVHQQIIANRGRAWYNSLISKSREKIKTTTIGYYKKVLEDLQ